MKLSRRSFLQSAGLAGGILLVDVRVPLQRRRRRGHRHHRRLDPHRSGRPFQPADERHRDGAGRAVRARADSRRGARSGLVAGARRLRAGRPRALRHVGDVPDGRQRFDSRHVRSPAQSRRHRASDVDAGGRAALGSARRGMCHPQRLRTPRAIITQRFVCRTRSRRGAVVAAEGRAAEGARRMAAHRQVAAASRRALEGQRHCDVRHRRASAWNALRRHRTVARVQRYVGKRRRGAGDAPSRRPSRSETR